MSDSKSISEDIDLSSVPIRALSLSTRYQLSQYLNPQQYIATSAGLCRDYRGIAQLMGFANLVVTSVTGSSDPFKQLLEMYQNKSDATLRQLIQMIETIERFDIIDDMTPVIVNDAKHFLSNRPSNNALVESPKPEDNQMSLELNPVISYDAYVCYADQDFEFVRNLSQFLECPEIGLRLFIRDRDMCLGSWIYEDFTKTIDLHCRKVLIVFSPNFLYCHECQFQTMFAAGLAIEQRNRKLIPIIYQKCDLPPIVRMLTKIDMTRCGDTSNWSWNRLVASIRNDFVRNAIVYRQESRPERPVLLPLQSVSSTDSTDHSLPSLISLPSVCPSPTAPPLVSTQSSICSSIASESSDKSYESESLPIIDPEKSKISKKANNKKWIQSFIPFKQKFKM